MNKRVLVFTGTRAEFGLLTPLLRELASSDRVDLSIVASGAHLSLLHGMTRDAILAEGFVIDTEIEMVLAADSASATTKGLGLALIELGACFRRIDPDLLVVLGDRYEVLSACIAATIAGVPIAHIHGGEVTEGAFDDAIRHAITKLSHLHFVATEDFGRRVIQLGEAPDRVFVVGAPGADRIRAVENRWQGLVRESIGWQPAEPYAVVIYHPSTLGDESPGEAVAAILAGVKSLQLAEAFFVAPNADPRFGEVRTRLEAACRDVERFHLLDSIGHEAFLGLVAGAAVLVGNSSAGLIEAPLLGTPTVNVGERQRGRPRSPSVVDVPPVSEIIASACRGVLAPAFTEIVERRESPYATGGSVARSMATIIESTNLSDLALKRFHDLP